MVLSSTDSRVRKDDRLQRPVAHLCIHHSHFSLNFPACSTALFPVYFPGMSQLSDALRTKLIPWARQENQERFVVARPLMSAVHPPAGVALRRRKLAGPRVIMRNRRHHGSRRNIIAEWPNDQMQESNHYKLVCVLSGQIDFRVGSYTVQCGEGFILLLPPGLPRTNAPYNARESACHTLSLLLLHHAVQCFTSRATPGKPWEGQVENYLFPAPRVAQTLQLIVDELMENREQCTPITNDLFLAFWAALQREALGNHYTNPGPMGRPSAMPQTPTDFKAELEHYFQKHLHQNLSLERVARAMYLSRAQFSRRIRQETGKSFVEFLTDYRIAEGKTLLQDSSWPVAAIAEFLGFRSASYFQTVFRRHTGQTPTEYRKTEK